MVRGIQRFQEHFKSLATAKLKAVYIRFLGNANKDQAREL